MYSNMEGSYELLHSVRCGDRARVDAEIERLRLRGMFGAGAQRMLVTWLMLYWELQPALDVLNEWDVPFVCNRKYVLAHLFEDNEVEKLRFMRQMGAVDEREFLVDVVRGGDLALVQRLVPEFRESFRIHTGEWISFERLLEVAEERGGAVWQHLKELDEAAHPSDHEEMSADELLYGENEMLSDYNSDEPYQHWW